MFVWYGQYEGVPLQISHRAFDPPMSDELSTIVLCYGGLFDQKLIKVSELKSMNQEDGEYRKDPACTWKNPADGEPYPVYRWKTK